MFGWFRRRIGNDIPIPLVPEFDQPAKWPPHPLMNRYVITEVPTNSSYRGFTIHRIDQKGKKTLLPCDWTSAFGVATYPRADKTWYSLGAAQNMVLADDEAQVAYSQVVRREANLPRVVLDTGQG